VIAFVNYAFDAAEPQPEELLVRDPSVGVWAAAVARAGGGPVAVVRRSRHEARLRVGEVDYWFVADGGLPEVPPWFGAAPVVEAVRALAPEVVHVDGMVYPLQVRLFRTRLPPDVALLVQDHGGIHADSPGFQRWLWRRFFAFGLSAADGFLFAAADLAQPWLRAGIISPQQTIHVALESSTDLAALPPVPGGPVATGRPAVLWVARLDANKDPLTVLTGFERAARALAAAELTMVFGTDDLLPAVRERIASSALLRPRVHLLGRIEQRMLAGLYATADLFVLGSHHESCGYALLEALAFGVTPVVTDIPPFRALTDDGRIGALFPVGNATLLAKALVKLGHADLASRREGIRGHFARALSWPAVGNRAAGIYERARAQARARVATGSRRTVP
jgi:glycosyltransferase involved in cell wall biosynthesis